MLINLSVVEERKMKEQENHKKRKLLSNADLQKISKEGIISDPKLKARVEKLKVYFKNSPEWK